MSGIAEQLTTAEGRDWLAMQFVLGELTELQAAEFDAALMSDPGLCDAVVNASRLMSGIALACESNAVVSHLAAADRLQNVGSQSRSLLRSRFKLVVTAAAALGVLATVVNSQLPHAASLLSSSVSATVADVATADALVSLLADDSTVEMDADSEEFGFAEDSLSDLAAPEWLLTAVELEQDETADESPVDGGVY